MKKKLRPCYVSRSKLDLAIKLANSYAQQANITDKMDYYPKAIGIFHYAFILAAESQSPLEEQEARQKEIIDSLSAIEKSFLKSFSKHSISCLGVDRIVEHKASLNAYRQKISKLLEAVAKLKFSTDPDNIINSSFIKRIEAIQGTYLKIKHFLIGENGENGLIKKLFDECLDDLGGIPQIDERNLQYAVYTFGFTALGIITSCYAIELGILIEEGLSKEKTAEVKSFFRSLLTLMQIRIINFGETPINTLDIAELKSAADNWFDDQLTKTGLSLKTSSGTALICTPSELKEIISNEERKPSAIIIRPALRKIAYAWGDKMLMNIEQPKNFEVHSLTAYINYLAQSQEYTAKQPYKRGISSAQQDVCVLQRI